MLYFLYGTDTTKARTKLRELLDSLHKKRPDAELFRVETEQWNDAQFEEFLGGQGLFSHKYIVVLDRVFENVHAKEHVVDSLEDIAHSENVFICIENAVDTPTLKKVEKYAQKVQECALKVVGKKQVFNMFALTDAFGARDKKKLWALYHEARFNGSEPEEVHGILFWQLKSMIVACESGSAEAAGLKPFVYQKARGFAKHFSSEELRAMSSELVRIYHDARRGLCDMNIALERFILSA